MFRPSVADIGSVSSCHMCADVTRKRQCNHEVDLCMPSFDAHSLAGEGVGRELFF